MEKTEFGEIITKVSGIVNGSNKLPWLLSARPMLALLLAGGLWLPAFIAVLVIHVDDDSGSKSAMFVCLSTNRLLSVTSGSVLLLLSSSLEHR